ncbi:MAG: aspartate aminotransferase family protein [Rhodothermales bacterium]
MTSTSPENWSALQAKHFMQCWSTQKDYAPIPIISADGCWLTTQDGRKIFDLRSAHECINLGFRHPRVLSAMKKQMDAVVYVTDDFATEPTALLAQKLASITPGSPNKRVWFGQSGAAAVEAAIKAARFYKYHQMTQAGTENLKPENQFPYPYKVISRYRSWHGATAGASAASGDPRRWFLEPLDPPGFKHAPEANCYRCPLNHTYPSCDLACASYIDQMIELEGGSNKVAAVLVETVVGSNGIIPPPPGYFKKLREICDQRDILLIVDETMTGMGRTGKMLAIEHYDIEPDIIIMGKALGAYCPLTATIFSEKVAKVFDDVIFGHGQSFSGHALGSAAALEGIRVLEDEKLVERSAELGEYLGEKLRQLANKHKSVGDVRGMGLFWTMELVKNQETREPVRHPTQKYGDSVVRRMAKYLFEEKHIYVPGDKFGLWIVPPLVVSKDELDFLVDAFDDALNIADEEVTLA